MSVRSRASSYATLENTNNTSTVELDPAWRSRGSSPTLTEEARPVVFSKFTGINNAPLSTPPAFQPVVSRLQAVKASENAFYAGKPNKLVNPYMKLKNKATRKRKNRKSRKSRR